MKRRIKNLFEQINNKFNFKKEIKNLIIKIKIKHRENPSRFCKYFITLKNICSFPYILFITFVIIGAGVGLAELYIRNGYVIKFGWWVIISIIIIFVLILLFVYVFINGKYSVFSKSPTKFDGFLIIVLLSSFGLHILFSPVFPRYYNLSFNYMMAFHISFFASFWFLLVRFICYVYFYNKNIDEPYLLDCLENKDAMPLNTDTFFIADKLVEKDLLNRSLLISQVRDFVFNFSSKRNRVIGITGKWGSGKSALLKFAYDSLSDEEKLNYVMINDFNCWDYEDERSLFIDVIKKLYKTLKLGSFNQSTINQIEGFANTVLNDAPPKSDLVKFLFPPKNSQTVKDLIESKLKFSKKHYIFVFENIDRAYRDNIIYVYKAISSVLKFSNITYVCLYDENIVKEALESKGFNYTYLDKVLDYKISIPSNEDKELLNLSTKFLNNYLDKYFLNKFNYFVNKNQINESLKFIDNPRDLSRFINILNIKLKNCDVLNISDLVTLSVIKTVNFDLYNFIYLNKRLLTKQKNISSQKMKEIYTKYFYDEEKQISGPYRKYQKLFLMLFPYLAEIFKENKMDYFKEYSLRPLCIDTFFDLYFNDIEIKQDKIAELSEEYNFLINDAKLKKTFLLANEKAFELLFLSGTKTANSLSMTNYCSFIISHGCFERYHKKAIKYYFDNNSSPNMDTLVNNYLFLLNRIDEKQFKKLNDSLKKDDINLLPFFDKCSKIKDDNSRPTVLIETIINKILLKSNNIFAPKIYDEQYIDIIAKKSINKFKNYLTLCAETLSKPQIIKLLDYIYKNNAKTGSILYNPYKKYLDSSKYLPILRKIKTKVPYEQALVSEAIRMLSLKL